MANQDAKVWLITGSSTGFGRSLAQAVLENGDCVVATARKPDQLQDLMNQHPETAISARLDVTDADDRQSAIQGALQHFGRIDVLVNNAGYGSLGALEEFSSEQIRQQFEVNLFGSIEMTRLILPTMRAQKSGHILNVSSIGGLVSMGGFSVYCATKFAVEGFSEALRDEVKPLGIHVTIVEPGAFRTNFSGDSNVQPETTIDEYQAVIEPIRQYLYGNDGKQPGDPHKAALAMIQAVESDNPPLRLMLGADAFGLWEKKRSALDAELANWREVGENTAFPGVEVGAIGG